MKRALGLRLSTVELAEHDECADDAAEDRHKKYGSLRDAAGYGSDPRLVVLRESHPYVADQHDNNQQQDRPEDGGHDEGDCGEKGLRMMGDQYSSFEEMLYQ